MSVRFVFISAFILFFIFTSCWTSTEEEWENYSFTLRNETEKGLVLKGTLNNQALIDTLLSAKSFYECKFLDTSYGGGWKCLGDVVELKFPDGRGYICYALTFDADTLCFQDGRNPLGRGTQVNPNSYEFVITQEDYENAHVLPE